MVVMVPATMDAVTSFVPSTAASNRVLSLALLRKQLMLTVALASATQIKMELMPAGDEGTIAISVTTRPGIRLAEKETILAQVEEVITTCSDVRFLQFSIVAAGQTEFQGIIGHTHPAHGGGIADFNITVENGAHLCIIFIGPRKRKRRRCPN